MKKLHLKRLGQCSICQTWHPLANGSCNLPDHEVEGEECSNLRYCQEIKYQVETLAEAKVLAELIIADGGKCFSKLYDGWHHSLACNDGKDCEKERLRLSKALAEFFLRTTA